jgi:hypothetical protein
VPTREFVVWVLVVLWLLFWAIAIAQPVHADVLHAPAAVLGTEWTPEARETLAHAVNAEADWNPPDHVAIGWVFLRRWLDARGRVPFTAIITRYVSAYATKHPSARHKRVLATQESCERPEGWDDRAGRWEGYAQPRCRALWARVDAWARGELKDPCTGAPRDFGGAMDSPQGRMVPVSCKGTVNVFYAHDAHKLGTLSAVLAAGLR